MKSVNQLTHLNMQQLPDAFAINLSQTSAISLTGDEQFKYLQGQVTCDVNTLEQKGLLSGGHCNAKGKLFSVFRLFKRNDQLLMVQPTSSLPTSLAELQKFGVFAKVEITETAELSLYAIAGEQAATALANHFTQIPDALTPVIQSGTTSLVYIAGKVARYLVIDSAKNTANIIEQLALSVYDHQAWNLLEISEGFPLLSEAAVGEYVPQMLNLQAIGGISFTKGCYLGQETVARMQYLGKNKRALFSLYGENIEVNAGDIIEKKLGDNWRKAGDVLVSADANSQLTYIQAILANDIEQTTELRIKAQETKLTILPLPYSLSASTD